MKLNKVGILSIQEVLNGQEFNNYKGLKFSYALNKNRRLFEAESILIRKEINLG